MGVRSRCGVALLSCVFLAIPIISASAAPSAPSTAISWQTIRNPGNPSDPLTGVGAVPYVYRIAKYEVTNAQYAEMLTAVARTDPHALYDPLMDPSHSGGLGSGIVRSGVPGSYAYAAAPGREKFPVNYVSIYDAMRFANWVQNGKHTGDTESGAYTLLGGTPVPTNANSVVRSAGAKVFIPNDSEWFKAAYYSPTTHRYFLYPTGTDAVPTCTTPTPKPNAAACNNAIPEHYAPVGSYPGSPSPYGTYDQGGNIHEWLETITSEGQASAQYSLPFPGAENRKLHGGDGVDPVDLLASTNHSSDAGATEFSAQGFRLAAAAATNR